jgi:predicted Zn-dependent protease
MIDDLYRQATKLARHDLNGAVALLRAECESLRESGDYEEAGTLSISLAALLSGYNRLDEALAAYKEAEADEPQNPFTKLHLASFLVHSLGQPTEALEKITAALPRLSDLPSSFHAGQAVLGSTMLALDRPGEAVVAFRRMTAPEVLKNQPAVSCDFWLVTELIERRLVPLECRAYLQEIVRKADSDGDKRSRGHAEKLLSKIVDAG